MQRSLSSNTTHEAALPDGFVSAAIDPVSFISNCIATTMTHHSICATIPDAAIDIAERNLRDILTLAIEHLPARSAIVVWDAQCDLAIAHPRPRLRIARE